jgi:glycine/D-amino acid oxidase-like deaminating enzyme
LNLDPLNHGLWATSAAPLQRLPTLTEPITADVIVVGAGFTGLSTALHLAEHGAKAVVLEAADVGFGGSGRNVGLVNAGLWLKPSDLRRALATPHGDRLLENLGNAPSLVFDLIARYGIECEALRHGTLHCAVGGRGLRDIETRHQEWRALHADVELLDAEATRGQVGSSAFAASLLDRRAGTIQPLSYVRGLARAALSQGSRIFTGTPVTDAQNANGTWMLKTPQGAVSAPWVIVATNVYSTGLWSAVAEEMVRLPYFNFATEPLRAEYLAKILPQRQGIWDSRKMLTSLRRDQAGRLIFGSIGALHAGARVHRDWAARSLRKLFPELHGIRFEHEWFGSIGMTRDAVPRFHRLARNTYSISGYNGRGIAPGTAFGRELAQLAMGRITESQLSLPLTPLMRAPWRRSRERIYEWGAAALHRLF